MVFNVKLRYQSLNLSARDKFFDRSRKGKRFNHTIQYQRIQALNKKFTILRVLNNSPMTAGVTFTQNGQKTAFFGPKQPQNWGNLPNPAFLSCQRTTTRNYSTSFILLLILFSEKLLLF